MKLTDLIKNIGGMSDEQLRQHIEGIRHRKYVEKPAVKKRIADEEKKEKNNNVIRKVDKAIDAMSEAEKAELLKKLLGEG